MIGQWLAEDRANWRKQGHTATGIRERSGDGHGAEVSLSTVTRAVAQHGRGFAAGLGEGVTGIEYDDDRPDPGEYDIAFAGDAGVQGGGR